MKTIALARKERENDGNNNNVKPSGELHTSQDVSRQKRRLLDIAWKMYDITSEMFYLKSDVASLISKVDSLEAAGVKESHSGRGRGLEIKSEEDFSPGKEIGNVGSKGLLAQRKKQIHERSKEGSILSMDDLSFLIFKEIVGEIAAECVGKIMTGDSELDNERFKDLREVRKNHEKIHEREGDKYFKESKEERPIFQRYDSEPKIYTKNGIEDTPTSWRYGRQSREASEGRGLAKYDSFSFEDRHEKDRELAKSDPVTVKKKVSFRRNDSNIEDGSPPEDAFFSRLNDSLYFHRSHLSPEQNSRYKLKHNSSSGKISPAISSDGSDFL